MYAGPFTAVALLAQEAAEPAVADEQQAALPFWWTVLPWLLIGAWFYFIFIRTEQRRKAEATSLLAALKKNDRVETIGGIRGTVVIADPGSEEVVVRIDENNGTRIHLRRDAVARVLNRDKAEDKKESA